MYEEQDAQILIEKLQEIVNMRMQSKEVDFSVNLNGQSLRQRPMSSNYGTLNNSSQNLGGLSF